MAVALNGKLDKFKNEYYLLGEGIPISASSDLNSYTNIGNYYCPANTIAVTLQHCPTKEAFTMTISYPDGVGGYLAQTVTAYNSGAKWYRIKNSSPNYQYGEWIKLY